MTMSTNQINLLASKLFYTAVPSSIFKDLFYTEDLNLCIYVFSLIKLSGELFLRFQ